MRSGGWAIAVASAFGLAPLCVAACGAFGSDEPAAQDPAPEAGVLPPEAGDDGTLVSADAAVPGDWRDGGSGPGRDRSSYCSACADAAVCCVEGLQATCADAIEACTKLALSCVAGNDCGSEKCCLAKTGVDEGSTRCKPSCPAGEQELCRFPSDCPSPTTCQPAVQVPKLLNLKSCQQ